MAKKETRTKAKKPIYKKWWFWVIVLIILGAAGSGKSDNNKSSDRSTDQAESQDPASSEENDPAEITPVQDNAEESDNSINSGNYTLPSGFDIHFSDSVRNDVTGNWRISTTSDNFVPAEYAVEYYETMFSSNDEIHAIWNATLGTTTRITVVSGIIFADTLEYVEGEEHDAKLLFSGQLLNSKMFDVKTGDEISTEPHQEPEQEPEQEQEQEPEPEPEPEPKSSQEPESNTHPASTTTSSSSSGNGSGNADNFNTYDNASQQQTEDTWVLNTKSMKIHYPKCSQVKKIAKKNYSTSNAALDTLKSKGYSTCGVCFK